MAIKETELESIEKRAYGRRLQLAGEVMDYVRSSLVALLPFLNRALLKMPVKFYRSCPDEMEKTKSFGTDTHHIFCYSDSVLYLFGWEKEKLPRLYLHTILHCLFFHQAGYEKLIMPYWDFASDVAVEAVILELGLKETALKDDPARQRAVDRIREKTGHLTAEGIYHYLTAHREEAEKLLQEAPLFEEDGHDFWISDKEAMDAEEEQELLQNQEDTHETSWNELVRYVTADLRMFQKNPGVETGSLLENMGQAEEERYDYSEFLRKFASLREESHLNQEEFDYIYYEYGRQLYGNIPLIEPLEYRETRKIRDFVVVLDTSGSCRGELIRHFLNATYGILRQCVSFEGQLNVHIIQCDAAVKKDIKITSGEEFSAYMQDVQIYGYGGTDFRPAFAYVDELIRQGEFEDLRGLLYFTDGWGIYPDAMPPYQTAFIFAGHDPRRPKVPAWAMSLEIQEEEFQEGRR